MIVKTANENSSVYDICFVHKLNSSISKLISEWLQNHLGCKRALIITDNKVAQVQNQALKDIEAYVKVHHQVHLDIYIVSEGEGSKSLAEAEKIWCYMAESHFTRSDLLIAFGGGMIGDLVGFCASTYLRGVSFIQIPTTLLSQIDSSVGGKVAINLSYGKNLVGQFYNPERVIIDVALLSTLEASVLQDGLGELIKYAFMGMSTLLNWLLLHGDIDAIRKSISVSPLEIEQIVKTCLEIKRTVVEKDYIEVRERKFLNFGHTIGHAIESACDYKLGHGYCVVLGMSKISDIGWRICREQLADVSDKTMLMKREEGFKRFNTVMKDVMQRYGFDLEIATKCDEWLPFVIQDKKRVMSDIQMILPRFEAWADYAGELPENDESILTSIEQYLEIVKLPIAELERYVSELNL